MIPALYRAQEYLTFHDGCRQRKLVDLIRLARIHTPQALVSFLDILFEDKAKELNRLLGANRTSFEIDKTVAQLFRIQLAIYEIRKHREDDSHAKTEP